MVARPMGMAGGVILWVGVCVGLLGAGGCGRREGSPGRAQKAVGTSQPASAPTNQTGWDYWRERPGRWHGDECPHVGVLPGGVYRVQEETTTDLTAVPGLLRKAGVVLQTDTQVNVDVLADGDRARAKAVVDTLLKAGVGYVLCVAGRNEATREELSWPGFAYWALEMPVDLDDAVVVVVATVEGIDHKYEGPEVPWKLPEMDATMRIREFLRVDRKAGSPVLEKEWPVPGKDKWLRCGGTEDLWLGDTVVVLAQEYDGALAIRPRVGGGCRLGAKLTGLHDPLLESIRYAVAHGMEAGFSHPVHGPRLKAIWAPWPESAETPESQPE